MSSTPLEGIKILDLTQNLPGPYCTMLLSDLGAEVIKVERPGSGDFARTLEALFDGVNRNKRSVTVDLKQERGVTLIKRLAESCDVFLEGFRPGVVDRLGVGYDAIREVNPRIVYCSISGYGQDGPYRDIIGHDINYLAAAGLLGITGEAGRPPVVPGVPVVDLSSAMFAVFGILAALISRDKAGKGQYVDVSMTDSMVSWMAPAMAQYSATGKPPERGNILLTGSVIPAYSLYETKDGKYITLGVLETRFWRNFCQAIDRNDLINEQFATGKQGDRTKKELQELFRSKTRDEWTETLWKIDVPYAPVLSLDGVIEDPHVKHRKMVVEVPRKKGTPLIQTGIALKFSETPGEIRSPPPALGEHTGEVLQEMGYSDKEIKELREAKVI